MIKPKTKQDINVMFKVDKEMHEFLEEAKAVYKISKSQIIKSLLQDFKRAHEEIKRNNNTGD